MTSAIGCAILIFGEPMHDRDEELADILAVKRVKRVVELLEECAWCERITECRMINGKWLCWDCWGVDGRKGHPVWDNVGLNDVGHEEG